MLSHLAMGATGALTLVATNLDNLALLIAFLAGMRRLQALGGFVLAQVIVLFVAAGVAEGIEATISQWAGYLGIVPLSLGLWGLRNQWTSQEGADKSSSVKGTFLGCLVMFLSLSTDSFAAFAPLLADTRQTLRVSLLIGAGTALALLAMLGVILSRYARHSTGPLARLDRLGPYAMIVVGVYVLANTGTDGV